jgi:tetratricopeptide (TPR) repeat protein
MKKVLLVMFVVFVTVGIKAKEKATVDKQILAIKAEQQDAVNRGDLEKLKEISSKLERLSTFGDKEWLVNYYLALNSYRISTIAYDNKEMSEKYIESAKEAVQQSIKDKDDFAESHALFSSILGMEIGFKPQLGMINGIQSGNEIEKAKKLTPENPRVYLIDGTGKLYTPAMFGGGIDKAIGLFEKAAELFAKETDTGIYPDWGKDEVYVWLGNAYKEKKEDSIATAFYKKALEVNPGCGWAREILKKDSLKCAEEKQPGDSAECK